MDPQEIAAHVTELRIAFARLEQAYKNIDRIVQTFGPTAGDLAKTEADVDQVARDVDDLKDWIGDVETRLRDELRRAEQRQSENAKRIETACKGLVTELRETVKTLKTDMTAAANTKLNARAVVTAAAISSVATILAGKL